VSDWTDGKTAAAQMRDATYTDAGTAESVPKLFPVETAAGTILGPQTIVSPDGLDIVHKGQRYAVAHMPPSESLLEYLHQVWASEDLYYDEDIDREAFLGMVRPLFEKAARDMADEREEALVPR
jgi:hypothetical protein